MPQSAAQRRMRDGWNRLIERASVAAQAIPPDGLSRSEFIDSVLTDVQPGEVDEVLKALHARKVVWVGRRGGIIRIHAGRPAGIPEHRPSEDGVVRFLSLVAPHFTGLASAERTRAECWRTQDWKGNDEAQERIRSHVHRILITCRTQAQRGVSVAAIREALHETFADDAMAALVYYETRLQRHALDESLEAFESSKPKGMPKRLGLDTRVLRLVERAGDVGITHSRVIKAIRPALPSATVREAAQRLVARGIIEARIVKPSAGGRPGERYFAAA